MRVALLSDVHANLAALEAVLTHAADEGVEGYWALGDLVGYGPDPDEVVARLRELGAAAVMGNHDAAATGLLPTEDFNDVAAAAVRWTAGAISEETAAYLRALPETRIEEGVTIVHGSLRHPLWEYLMGDEPAAAHFALQETPLSVVGHTHIPLIICRSGEDLVAVEPEDGDEVLLEETPACVNPGGIGQPRDGDPRAAYAVLDTTRPSATFYRVSYDIARTQERIIARGLPERLARRLAAGH